MSKIMDEISAKGIELYYQGIADTAPNYPAMHTTNMPVVIEQLNITLTPIEE